MGIQVIAAIEPKNSGQFPTHHAIYGEGGFQARANTAARDAIPALNRSEGMHVYCIATDTLYRLGAGLGNGDWVVASAGALSYPLAAPDGTAAAPSYGWTSEAGLGGYRIGAGRLGFSVGTELTYEIANTVITNLDVSSPAQVRYSMRGYGHAMAGANETTAYYWRMNSTWSALGNVFQYGAYYEIDSLQNYTYGGCATKVLHRGHGDAHFVGLVNGIEPKAIVDASNTNPIICEVTAHAFGQGDVVQIAGCTGNTAANGAWYGITVIDDDHFSLPGSIGNGAYTGNGSAQDINSPVAYEGAEFRDGGVSFLASCQKPGGSPNWTGFQCLYQADAFLTYGAFMAYDIPNNAFVSLRRTGLADTLSDGYPQILIQESLHRFSLGNAGSARPYLGGWNPLTAYVVGDLIVYDKYSYICILGHTNHVPPDPTYWTDVTDTPNLGRGRFQVFSSGRTDLRSLVATAAVPLVDSPSFYQYGSYYSAGAGHDHALGHVFHVTAAGVSEYRLLFGDPAGTPDVRFVFKNTGGGLAGAYGIFDMQLGMVQGVAKIEFVGADVLNTLDMQLGSITTMSLIRFNGPDPNNQLDMQTGYICNVRNIQCDANQFDLYTNGTVVSEWVSALNPGETALSVRRAKLSDGTYGLLKVSHVDAAGIVASGKRVLVIDAD